jgi:hypothetical protein
MDQLLEQKEREICNKYGVNNISEALEIMQEIAKSRGLQI